MPNQTGATEGKMELTSENLNAEMDKFKTAIKRGNSSTVGLINSARIYVPNNKTLVLNFATQILCDMMRDENNMKVMRIVVEYFFLAKTSALFATLVIMITQNTPTTATKKKVYWTLSPNGLMA